MPPDTLNTRTRRRLGILAVGAVLAGGACDAGPAETEATPPPAAEAEAFAVAAEEVCRGVRTELQPLRDELFERDPLTPADAQQSFERAAALLATEIRQLEDLSPPAGQDAAVGAWLDELRAGQAAYDRGATAPEDAEDLLRDEDPLSSADAAADELGLEICGTERLPTDEQGNVVPIPTEDLDG